MSRYLPECWNLNPSPLTFKTRVLPSKAISPSPINLFFTRMQLVSGLHAVICTCMSDDWREILFSFHQIGSVEQTQAWWQVSLPTEASYWPLLQSSWVSIILLTLQDKIVPCSFLNVYRLNCLHCKNRQIEWICGENPDPCKSFLLALISAVSPEMWCALSLFPRKTQF